MLLKIYCTVHVIAGNRTHALSIIRTVLAFEIEQKKTNNKHSLLKNTIEPCPKHNRNCKGCNGYNGNCIGFNGNYNGVWYVVDSIGGMLNHIGNMPKTHYKNKCCNGFT